MNVARLCALLVVVELALAPLAAQQRVPINNGIPVAPTGIVVPPLPDRPVTYKTAEGQDIRVVVAARGLANPWSLAFLPDGAMLVIERPGRLRVIRNGVLDPQPVAGVPEVRAQGLCGLFDVALHPRFSENRFIYTGDRLPKWKGDVFVGGMRYGEIPGTGQLQRILINENLEELRREPLLVDLRQRIRDVRQGPDELLYLVTDHAKDGAVLRIEPTS